MKRPSPRAWYKEVRTAHPVRVLRWLRNGVLLAISATMLLWLVVATSAHHEIGDARRTQQAIADITDAQAAAQNASNSLKTIFATGGVSLTGTGNDFSNYTAQVTRDITEVAVGNAAGETGQAQIQFVLGQLETCIQLAETDARPYIASADDATACLTDPDQVIGKPITGTGGLTSALADLKQAEATALAAQRDSLWLSPLIYWWLLLLPSAVMLVLGVASGGILARHFRRRLGPLLPVAAVLTLAAAILVGAFSELDSHSLPADPLASEPIVVLLVVPTLLVAMALAHSAYRPRLAEYRFPHS